MRAAAAVAVLALSAAAYADDAEQPNPDSKALLEYVKKLENRVNQLEQEKQWPLDQVRSQSGSALENAVHAINLSGHMEFQYGFNLRHGGGGVLRGDTLAYNQLAGSSNDDNGFSFQQLQLLVDKPLTTVNSTGFRVRAEWGDVSIFNNRDGAFSAGEGAFNVREAYMSWRAQGGGMANHIDLTLGQMDSPLGIETPDNTTNWLVTRSFEHNLANPITHTGLRGTVAWNESHKTSLYVVNGWDVVRDAGDGKTVILSHEMGKFDSMNSTLTFNLSYGHEGSIYIGGVAPDGDKTKFAEVIWRADINDDNKVAVDGFWAKTDNGAFDGHGGIESRDFHGISAYFRHQMSKQCWFAARGEYYLDDVIGMDGKALRVYGVSLAAGWDVADDVAVVLELRHDHAFTGLPFFGKSADNPNDDQDRVTASVVYSF